MIEHLANFDLWSAEYFLNHFGTPLWDKIMIFITSLGDGGVIWIACGIILLIFKKTRTCGAALLFSLAISFLLSQLVIKELVNRPRPFSVIEGAELLVAVPRGSSFPSSHTVTAFASAISIFCFNKLFGVLALVLATIIGFSRIYLGVHFVSDVVLGAILGLTLGFFLTRILFFKKDTEVDSE